MKLFLQMFVLTNLMVGGLAMTGCEREEAVTPAVPSNPTVPPVDTGTPRTATGQVTPPVDTSLPTTAPSTMPTP